MTLEVLQDIKEKVDELHRLIIGTGGISDRVDKMWSSLYSGSGAGLVITSASIAEVLRSTNFATGSAGWEIQKDGDVEFQDGTFRGDITADSGFFAGTVYVGETSDRIVIDGSSKVLKSENFTTNQQGWQINGDGDAEFQDVKVRGELITSVFTTSEVSSVSGSQLIVQSAGTLRSDVTTVSSPTTFDVEINDPLSHTQLFQTGDILRIKNGTLDNWMTVSSVTDNTTYFTYTCTLDSGTPGTFYAGNAVLDYGQSGDGGIFLTADDGNAPFIQMFTHAGSPWSAQTAKTRIGNLNGYGSYASDLFGVAIGDPANQWIAVDDTNGLRVLDGSSAQLQIDASGNFSLEGVLELGSNGGLFQGSGSFASPTTALKIWNDGGTGRIAGYAGGTIQWYADTDGKLYAGDGKVKLDEDGITITEGNVENSTIKWGSYSKIYSTSGDGLVLESEDSGGDSEKARIALIYNDGTEPNIKIRLGSVTTGTSGYNITQDEITFLDDSTVIPNLGEQTWTPQLYQNGNVTSTTDHAYVWYYRGLVFLQVAITCTGTGTANKKIEIRNLPYAMQHTAGAPAMGSFRILDSGTATYVGIAETFSGPLLFRDSSTRNFVGISPNFALANGDKISFVVMYRTTDSP